MKTAFTLVMLALLGIGFVYSEHNRLDSADLPASLNLSGTIDNNFVYLIVVQYAATKDRFWCKHQGLAPFTYAKASTKSREYRPAIGQNHHSLSVPLSEFSPTKGCRYQLMSVNLLAAEPPHKPVYQNSLLFNAHHPQLNGEFFERIKRSPLTDNQLNVVCFPKYQIPGPSADLLRQWTCRRDHKEKGQTMLDVNSINTPDIELNIRSLSMSEYRLSCFHWARQHEKQCQ